MIIGGYMYEYVVSRLIDRKAYYRLQEDRPGAEKKRGRKYDPHACMIDLA